MPSFSKRSADNLSTATPNIQMVFNEVVKKFNCSVVAGHRGEAKQNRLFVIGRSQVKYPESKHNSIPS